MYGEPTGSQSAWPEEASNTHAFNWLDWRRTGKCLKRRSLKKLSQREVSGKWDLHVKTHNENVWACTHGCCRCSLAQCQSSAGCQPGRRPLAPPCPAAWWRPSAARLCSAPSTPPGPAAAANCWLSPPWPGGVQTIDLVKRSYCKLAWDCCCCLTWWFGKRYDMSEGRSKRVQDWKTNRTIPQDCARKKHEVFFIWTENSIIIFLLSNFMTLFPIHLQVTLLDMDRQLVAATPESVMTLDMLLSRFCYRFLLSTWRINHVNESEPMRTRLEANPYMTWG